jgi:hypothetical protein
MLARFTEETPHPIMRVSPAGAVVYANPAARGLLNEWGTAVGGRLPAEAGLAFEPFSKNGSARDFEVTASGRHMRFTPISAPGTTEPFFLGLDITGQKRFEEAICGPGTTYRLFSISPKTHSDATTRLGGRF